MSVLQDQELQHKYIFSFQILVAQWFYTGELSVKVKGMFSIRVFKLFGYLSSV